jgi:hypothetical protein
VGGNEVNELSLGVTDGSGQEVGVRGSWSWVEESECCYWASNCDGC